MVIPKKRPWLLRDFPGFLIFDETELSGHASWCLGDVRKHQKNSMAEVIQIAIELDRIGVPIPYFVNSIKLYTKKFGA
jgi:hypothetical protein